MPVDVKNWTTDLFGVRNLVVIVVRLSEGSIKNSRIRNFPLFLGSFCASIHATFIMGVFSLRDTEITEKLILFNLSLPCHSSSGVCTVTVNKIASLFIIRV